MISQVLISDGSWAPGVYKESWKSFVSVGRIWTGLAFRAREMPARDWPYIAAPADFTRTIESTLP